MVLKEWQMEILKIFNHEPEKRLVYIVCDEIGNTGKTVLAQYLSVKYGDEVLVLTPSKAENILHLAACRYSDKFGSKMIICDSHRTCGVTNELIGACEILKSQNFFSGKYSGNSICWEKPPHIVLFTNGPVTGLKLLLLKTLSNDRIRLGILTGEKLEWFRVNTDKYSGRPWVSCTVRRSETLPVVV
jgi:hypothetical protein